MSEPVVIQAPNPDELFATALHRAQVNAQLVGKSGQTDEKIGGWKFATEGDMLRAGKAALNAQGLFLHPAEGRWYELDHKIGEFVAHFILSHIGGHDKAFDTMVTTEGMRPGARGLWAMLSMARRETYGHILGLVRVDENADADAQAPDVSQETIAGMRREIDQLKGSLKEAVAVAQAGDNEELELWRAQVARNKARLTDALGERAKAVWVEMMKGSRCEKWARIESYKLPLDGARAVASESAELLIGVMVAGTEVGWPEPENGPTPPEEPPAAEDEPAAPDCPHTTGEWMTDPEDQEARALFCNDCGCVLERAKGAKRQEAAET